MKILNIQGIERKIPSDWQDVTLGRYLRIAKLTDNPDEEFKSLIIIEAYTDIPVLELKRMPLTDLHEITKTMQFIHTEIPQRPCTEFNIGEGKEYTKFYVIQNLLEAEAQDFFATEAIMQEAQQDAIKALPKLMAVLCKKDRENLDQINIEERQKLFMDNVNIVQAMGVQVFFSNLGLLYNLNSQFYTNREAIMEAKLKETEDILKQQVGMERWYGRWLNKTLRRFLQYYMQSWKTYSSGTVSMSKK